MAISLGTKPVRFHACKIEPRTKFDTSGIKVTAKERLALARSGGLVLSFTQSKVMADKPKQKNPEPAGLWIAQKHSFKGPRGDRAWENRPGGIPSHSRYLELADIALGLKKPKKKKPASAPTHDSAVKTEPYSS